jgi:maltose alpha-D-glucosyltransferase / alpha-amylase
LQREALMAMLGKLARRGIGSSLTRVHGDLHLGQTLVAGGEVYIIDFEGEPARSLEERRAKSSPLKDVAGVLRSFDYAAAVVQRRSAESHAHLADDRRDAFLAAFVEHAGAAFLAGYGDATKESPPLPEALLDLFLIEKAAYEVTYEAANRPPWIEVPLSGLAQLADRLIVAERAAADD